MTPLATAILEDYALPMKQRRFHDNTRLLPKLRDAHCFEVSAIADTAADLTEKEFGRNQRTLRGDLAFLPAPLTWLEWINPEDDSRIGVLLEDEDKTGVAIATWGFQCKQSGHFLSAAKTGALLLGGDGTLDQEYYSVYPLSASSIEEQKGWTALMYTYLAMINTPKIVGRKEYPPNPRLKQQLIDRKLAGPTTLRPWTEIILEVTPPERDGAERDYADQPERLTGSRALHFCRAHLRVQNGKLVRVRAHWKGDPEIGIVRSKYAVVP